MPTPTLIHMTSRTGEDLYLEALLGDEAAGSRPYGLAGPHGEMDMVAAPSLALPSAAHAIETKLDDAIREMGAAIAVVSEAVKRGIGEAKPDKVVIELGMALEVGPGGALKVLFVDPKVTGSMTITLEWDNP